MNDTITAAWWRDISDIIIFLTLVLGFLIFLVGIAVTVNGLLLKSKNNLLRGKKLIAVGGVLALSAIIVQMFEGSN
jgi:hypothetical protein